MEQVHLSDAVPLVRLGQPADSILSTIAELNCSLLVIGTIGRTDLSSLLLGSVAEAVISQARCSALIVPLSAAPQT
jgi:nucleotide-binding universal stress UspA family protein